MRACRIAVICAPFLFAACGGAQSTAAPAETPSAAATETAVAAPPEPPPPPAETASAAQPEETAPAAPKSLTIAIAPKSGSKLEGTATFTEQPDGVKVSVSVSGLKPGEHGVHVHEKGDCSAPDGKSAGGHFNPDNHDHALPPKEPRHLGDLGNVTVGKDGKGTLEIVIPGANLKPGDAHSFLDKAVIVHEKRDDGGQPTGNAGGRVGCGEIKEKS